MKKYSSKLIISTFILIPLLILIVHSSTTEADWHEMDSGKTYCDLYGIWGSSSTDVFAVGVNWEEKDEVGIILHYDGSSWSEMENGTTESLWGVWGSSATDIFAVGSSILHYNGSIWSVMESGMSARGIWGSSGTDVFAVGSSILHYDGLTWSVMEIGTSKGLRSVWGSSATDVFAVGSSILHYDGTSWTEMNSGTTELLWDVWGSSAMDVFAVGDKGTIIHYDGTSWSSVDSGMTDRIHGIWGSSATDVFAIERDYRLDKFEVWYSNIFHYDGSTWVEMYSGPTHMLYDIWGSSETDVFAVGEWDTILHYNGVDICLAKEIYRDHSEETELLRKLRDNVLSKTTEGQEIIKLYYEWSPMVVKAMEEDEELKETLKETINGILPLIRREVE